MIKDRLYTALVTPFKNDEVDYTSLSHLVDRQLKAHIDGILVLGSTGEASTLSDSEKTKILSQVSKQIHGKTQLMVGVGSNTTRTTIDNCKIAESYHANSLSIILPYYNKPTQMGVYQHFKAIAQNTHLPIVIYNNPSRCGISIHVDTLKALALIPNIIGIKDSSAQLDYIQEVSFELPKVRSDFKIYSGDDITLLPYCSLGACGIISVASNLIPSTMKRFMDLLAHKQYADALIFHRKLYSFFKSIFIEANPIPIKAALNLCDIASSQMRLPLTTIQNNHLEILEEILIQAEIIHGEVKPQSFKATI